LHENLAYSKESFYYSIFIFFIFFNQFFRNKEFQIYLNQIIIFTFKQVFFLDYIWNDLYSKIDNQFKIILYIWYKNIILENIKSFLISSQYSIILSFIHFIAQNLMNKYIYLYLILLITYFDFNYIMIEKVMQLFVGYFMSYEDENKSMTKSYLRMKWDVISNIFDSSE